MTYTEEQIRRAWEKKGQSVGSSPVNALIEQLRKDGHVHDFADDDAITVREFRAALKRMTDAGGWDEEAFLRDISEHREPDYPVKTLWKDADGVIWLRIPGKRWSRFSASGSDPDGTPRRPLRRMDAA